MNRCPHCGNLDALDVDALWERIGRAVTGSSRKETMKTTEELVGQAKEEHEATEERYYIDRMKQWHRKVTEQERCVASAQRQLAKLREELTQLETAGISGWRDVTFYFETYAVPAATGE